MISFADLADLVVDTAAALAFAEAAGAAGAAAGMADKLMGPS